MSIETERLQLKGRLAVKEDELRTLGLSIEGDISAIRALLPPFMDIAEIKAEQAAIQAVELASKHAEYLGLKEKIEAMKRALA